MPAPERIRSLSDQLGGRPRDRAPDISSPWRTRRRQALRLLDDGRMREFVANGYLAFPLDDVAPGFHAGFYARAAAGATERPCALAIRWP
jgi:hypothetical protein